VEDLFWPVREREGDSVTRHGGQCVFEGATDTRERPCALAVMAAL
jgi:hypothetical protein